MSMNKKLAALMLASIVGLTGCSRVEQGEVYDKKFVPAHTEHSVRVVSTVSGGHIGTAVVPVSRAVPDEWQIFIQDADGNTDRYKVSEETYAAVEIGVTYRVLDSDEGWIFEMIS